MATTDLFLQPALTSGFAWVGSRYILNNTGSVSVLGQSLDKNLAFAGMAGVGALVSNATKDYIIPKIPISNQDYKNIVGKAVGPAICGGGALVLEQVFTGPAGVQSFFGGVPNQANPLTNFAVSAGSYVASDYVLGMMKK
jgi:hypothetical protein